jgi:hypothetical protein
LFAVGMTPTPEAKAVVEANVAAVHESLAPWDAGSRYLNFTESKVPAQAIWRAETLARLKKVKATWDARDLFRSNHELMPTETNRHADTTSAARRAPRPVIAPSRIAPQRP